MINLITARNVSVLYLITYFSISFYLFPPESAGSGVGLFARQSLYYFVPLMCIWYGDELEEFVGIPPGKTPEWILKFGGWFLLLLPAVIEIVVFSIT